MLRALTLLVRREILRAAVFLWMTFFEEALWMVEMARFKTFCASSAFFSSTAFRSFLEKVFKVDLIAVFRSRLLSLWRALFKAEACVAKIPPFELTYFI
jgi:hypothetical protein